MTARGKKVATANKSTQPVAIEKVPGRLIQKVATSDGALVIEGSEAAQQAFTDAFASDAPDFISYSLLQLSNILAAKGRDDQTIEMNAAIAMLKGIAPTSELEAMLAAQMVATHHLSMEMTRRTLRAEMLPQFSAYGNLATKLGRTFLGQVDALSKLRRGGEQVVRHVHVNDGGQAIVAGTFNHGGGHEKER